MKFIKQCILYVFTVFLLMILIAVVFALLFGSPKVFAPEQAQAATIKVVDFIIPELRAICAAESTGNPLLPPRHWDSKGNVLRGIVNPRDIGQCQINLDVWGERATELGLDIFSFDGNIEMANWIYTNYGNKPWYLSKKMWNK